MNDTFFSFIQQFIHFLWQNIHSKKYSFFSGKHYSNSKYHFFKIMPLYSFKKLFIFLKSCVSDRARGGIHIFGLKGFPYHHSHHYNPCHHHSPSSSYQTRECKPQWFRGANILRPWCGAHISVLSGLQVNIIFEDDYEYGDDAGCWMKIMLLVVIKELGSKWIWYWSR